MSPSPICILYSQNADLVRRIKAFLSALARFFVVEERGRRTMGRERKCNGHDNAAHRPLTPTLAPLRGTREHSWHAHYSPTYRMSSRRFSAHADSS